MGELTIDAMRKREGDCSKKGQEDRQRERGVRDYRSAKVAIMGRKKEGKKKE